MVTPVLLSSPKLQFHGLILAGRTYLGRPSKLADITIQQYCRHFFCFASILRPDRNDGIGAVSSRGKVPSSLAALACTVFLRCHLADSADPIGTSGRPPSQTQCAAVRRDCSLPCALISLKHLLVPGHLADPHVLWTPCRRWTLP